MKNPIQTDTWMYHTAIVLGSMLMMSGAGIIILWLMKQSIPEILLTLGLVSGAGLAKLLISPLSRGLLE
jgi:hypothetical protein